MDGRINIRMSSEKHPNVGSSVAAANGNQAWSEIASETVPAVPPAGASGGRNALGQFEPKLSDEQLSWALQRLSVCDTMENICNELKIEESALYNRANRDPEFGAIFYEAIETGEHKRLARAEKMMAGVEGYTTGNIIRDKELIAHARWMASKRNRRVYGDRAPVQIGANGITINMPDGFGSNLG